jgi:ribosomal protein S18 acetylase RimI-like enzyme
MFRAMTAQPESYLNLVAVDDGQAVGFISILFYASFIHRVGTAQINELIVDSLKRHSGIGTRLLQRAKEEARRRGVDEIEVSTERDNLSALRFYRSNGFDEEYVLLGRELGGPSPMA